MPEKSSNQHRDIALKSAFDQLEMVVEETERFVRQHEDDDDVVYNIVLLTSEAVTNAIEHGNALDESKNVVLGFKVAGEFVTVSVQDEGEGFKASSVPNPLDRENLFSDGGRGLYLMEALADEIRYEDGGRRVVMRFRRSRK
jgi:serine/threonine-protein kinase RsbW